MNYLLKSSNLADRKKNTRNKSLLIVVILILIVLVMSLSSVRNMLFFIAKPIWQLENSILNSSFFEYLKSKNSLINERLEIENKLSLATNILAINSVLETENEYLKDLLNRKETKEKTVLGVVLAKPPQTPYDLLLVDIGQDYGVKVGDRVIANANVYIGEVTEVFSHTAKITLYSTPNKKLSVVLGTNSITAESIGVGGSNFNIFLPREIEVKEGDVVYVPSIMTNILGIVEKVNFKETDSFQTVLFKSPINISELNFVEIVI